jgi:hypothetical protein
MLVWLIEMGIALALSYMIYKWVYNKLSTLKVQEKVDNLSVTEEQWHIVKPNLIRKHNLKGVKNELNKF